VFWDDRRVVKDECETCVNTFATLVLLHQDLEPCAVSTGLGLKPSQSFAKGDLNSVDRPWQIGIWKFSSKGYVGSKDARRHIGWILDQLVGKETFLRELQAKDYKTNLSCYWQSVGHGGPELDPEFMNRLASLRLSLSFDVYYHGSGEWFFTESKYQVGQVWGYQTRSLEVGSTFVVLKVDTDPDFGSIVHIYLQGLKIKNSHSLEGFDTELLLVPVSEEALDKSGAILLTDNAQLPPYEFHYTKWKTKYDARRGVVFDVPIAQALDVIEVSINE
jgi:hypothetical protein